MKLEKALSAKLKSAKTQKHVAKSPMKVLHVVDSLLGIVEVSEDKRYVQTALVKVSTHLLVGLPTSRTKLSLGQT